MHFTHCFFLNTFSNRPSSFCCENTQYSYIITTQKTAKQQALCTGCLLSKQRAHTHIQMHICQQANATCITHPTVTHTHTGTPPASVHTHNVFLSPVAHRGLGKWSGMEEISTLIALFIYTGKAQGIWNMFTYGGRNVPSRLRNATQSPRNKSILWKYLQMSDRKQDLDLMLTKDP